MTQSITCSCRSSTRNVPRVPRLTEKSDPDHEAPSCPSPQSNLYTRRKPTPSDDYSEPPQRSTQSPARTLTRRFGACRLLRARGTSALNIRRLLSVRRPVVPEPRRGAANYKQGLYKVPVSRIKYTERGRVGTGRTLGNSQQGAHDPQSRTNTLSDDPRRTGSLGQRHIWG